MKSSNYPNAITVFCGSSMGNQIEYKEAAESLGREIAKSGRGLIYGGGTAGIMGTVASSTLSSGGSVHGIIPSAFLVFEQNNQDPPVASHLAKEGDKNLETVVRSMHERKKLMADLSRGFIGLPGGYGTLEELAEMTTWSQLGIHKKPVILLNVLGFYDGLQTFIERGIADKFISPSNRNFLIFVSPPSTSSSSTSTSSSSSFSASSTSTSPSEEETPFNWGQAALQALETWESKGLGGALAYDLNWPSAEEEEEEKDPIALFSSLVGNGASRGKKNGRKEAVGRGGGGGERENEFCVEREREIDMEIGGDLDSEREVREGRLDLV